MKFSELVEKRYSVRSYTEEAVDDSQLNEILECARLAPSAVNLQPWKFIVVRSEEGRKKVCSTYKRDWIQTAPMFIICCVCHDEAWVRKYDQKEHGNIDIAIAAEHICLAATEQGLGTCWVCNFDAVKCSELFNLPSNIEPAVIIPLGHPADEAKPKTRKAMNEIVEYVDDVNEDKKCGQVYHCNDCGADIYKHMVFCDKCGKKLDHFDFED